MSTKCSQFSQSAVMAGLKVVPVKTHHDGNLDLEDLKAKAEQHKDNLAAFMVRCVILGVIVHTHELLRSRILRLSVSLSTVFRT